MPSLSIPSRPKCHSQLDLMVDCGSTDAVAEENRETRYHPSVAPALIADRTSAEPVTPFKLDLLSVRAFEQLRIVLDEHWPHWRKRASGVQMYGKPVACHFHLLRQRIQFLRTTNWHCVHQKAWPGVQDSTCGPWSQWSVWTASRTGIPMAPRSLGGRPENARSRVR